jgi:formate hydrogenlyase subunit 3/multisubunit Na+/H+ antiporter MnhD subunit
MQPLLKPVWIRYYGLIPMTRRGYLRTLAALSALLVVFLLGSAALGGLPPLDTMWSAQHRLPGSAITAVLYNYFYWFTGAALAAQAVDTWCTMRAFARAEAEQWAKLSGTPDVNEGSD